MLDLGALRAFYFVGRFGGVGAAARELKVTQPAVSQRLSVLERSVGKKLYGQAGRKIVLTEDGRRLFEACRQAFDVLGAAEAALDGRSETPILGVVRIAALSEVSKSWLLPKVRVFLKKHPGTSFEVEYRLPYEMLNSLMRHDADFVVSNEPFRRPQVELVPVFKETIVCVGPGPSRSLAWSQLETLPWIGYGTEDPMWSEFEHEASRHGAHLPKPVLSVADVESVMRLAADGAGYALVPVHSLPLRALKGLVTHRLPTKELSRPIYLCRLKTVPMGRAAAEFWKELAKDAEK